MASVQGQPLEVTVIGCNGLRDTEWLSKQDPYVVLEYGNTKNRTKTCEDGDKDPTFQEKFVFPLIQGLTEMTAHVWNSNTLSGDDLIGSGKVQLTKAITQGFDDTPWPLSTKSGKHAGELKLILRYENNQQNYAPPPAAAPAPSPHGYGAPATPAAYPAPSPHQGHGGYPAPPAGYPQQSGYPQYPPHNQSPPPHHQSPAHHQSPPVHHQSPPAHHQSHPHHHQSPPHHHQSSHHQSPHQQSTHQPPHNQYPPPGSYPPRY